MYQSEVFSVRRLRLLLGFILAPLLASLAFACAQPLYEGLPSMTRRVLRTTLFVAVFGAYPSALLLGVPAYFALRRRFRLTLANSILVGTLVASLPWLLLSFASGPDYAEIGGQPTYVDGSRTLYGWIELAKFIGTTGGFGAIGGLVFWLVAVGPGKHNQPS